jgi:glycerol-3-phosphate O-acyltransferase/dihydroxyacetone phosphate acyltransferase
MAQIKLPTGLLRWLRPADAVQALWRWYCFLVVRVFYRRAEVRGSEFAAESGPMIVCANHPSALADPIVVQAAFPRICHPLARSGLFRNPLAWPVLKTIQAVPVYRRMDGGVDPGRNADAFARCHEMLERGKALLIFPEGESHSRPGMIGFKTGAARLALGSLERTGRAPRLLPVGLNYTDVGRFRSSVLVKFGPPVPVGILPGEAPEQAARRITEAVRAALERITLNPNSWAELETLRRLERFFALRHGKYRKRNLDHRFRTLQKLLRAHQRLRMAEPERVEHMRQNLDEFDRLCRWMGVRDYHLTVEYTPRLIAKFVARSLAMMLVGLPVGLWGAINSLAPFLLTKALATRLSAGRYQYDTAKFCLGLGFFSLFWGVQSWLAFRWAGGQPEWAWAPWTYAALLLPSTVVALYIRRERERILDNIRVFLKFSRQSDLREFLMAKRKALERELARLVYVALQYKAA